MSIIRFRKALLSLTSSQLTLLNPPHTTQYYRHYSSILSKISWALFKRETVGIDHNGNSYYRMLDKDINGNIIERRMVKYTTDDYDPLSIPPEWLQWLQKTRDTAPTQEDIQQGESARNEQQQRAADADAAAAEAAFRWQQQGRSNGDVGDFTQQVSSSSNQKDSVN